MTNRTVKGLLMMAASFIWATLETKYFGSNYWPESIAELICDGISLIGCFTGLYFMMTKTQTK